MKLIYLFEKYASVLLKIFAKIAILVKIYSYCTKNIYKKSYFRKNMLLFYQQYTKNNYFDKKYEHILLKIYKTYLF